MYMYMYAYVYVYVHVYVYVYVYIYIFSCLVDVKRSFFHHLNRSSIDVNPATLKAGRNPSINRLFLVMTSPFLSGLSFIPMVSSHIYFTFPFHNQSTVPRNETKYGLLICFIIC